MLLNFGQPIDGIVRSAYDAPDPRGSRSGAAGVRSARGVRIAKEVGSTC
jgi:hypothetical protein